MDIDEYVNDVINFVVNHPTGRENSGALTILWGPDVGTSYLTIPLDSSRDRAELPQAPTLSGVAKEGRAAVVYGWAVSMSTADHAIYRFTTHPAVYEIFAIVPSGSGDPECSATLAEHAVLIRNDPRNIEVDAFGGEREILRTSFEILDRMVRA